MVLTQFVRDLSTAIFECERDAKPIFAFKGFLAAYYHSNYQNHDKKHRLVKRSSHFLEENVGS